MDDLVKWFQTQLDERERDAQSGRGCEQVHPGQDVWHPDGHPDQAMLADVAADRAILTAYEEAATYYRARPDTPAGELHGLATAIKYRGTAYAHRPGYRPEWRP